MFANSCICSPFLMGSPEFFDDGNNNNNRVYFGIRGEFMQHYYIGQRHGYRLEALYPPNNESSINPPEVPSNVPSHPQWPSPGAHPDNNPVEEVHIKRPPNAWILYRKAHHSNCRKRNPGIKNDDICKYTLEFCCYSLAISGY